MPDLSGAHGVSVSQPTGDVKGFLKNRHHDCLLPGINNDVGISEITCRARATSGAVLKHPASKAHCSRCRHWTGPKGKRLWNWIDRPGHGDRIAVGTGHLSGDVAFAGWEAQHSGPGAFPVLVTANYQEGL